MSAPNPQVSVFHFTSRISSAKIRKYKLATERGMSSGGGNVSTSNATAGTLQAAPSPSLGSSTMEPPAKRPKIKLNVRRPSDSPDTIAVSRPKRDSTLRIRYSENMVIDSKDLEEADSHRKHRPSPAASSDLSSLTSVHSLEKESTPAKVPAAAPVETSSKRRDYSRDFMSYYVADGDEDEEEIEEVEPEPVVEKPIPPKPAPAPVVQQQPPKIRKPKPSEQPPAYPAATLQPPRPALPQPIVSVIDIPKSTGPREPDTVATLVKKLESLSTALTNFGGIPVLPQSPQEESEQSRSPESIKMSYLNNTFADPESQPTEERKDVDDFLAMFDDDDSDDKEAQKAKDGKSKRDLNYKLESPGESDSPLTYGIQFIQNALRSWAVQRTVAQYNQQYHQYYQQTEANSSKRGPGRPRKFDNGDEDRRPAPPPTHIRIDLIKTPEGAAIAAFQDVLDSECLQVNAVLPVPLTRALRRLYMQIDHLINQGSRNEPPWQCMSYGAQIAAQKIRVEKWKVAHAKAQQEMIRQQHLAQQQVMQQMGIPPHQRNLTAEQIQNQHAIDLERKRSLQHAAQQPHLTQYLTNPLRLNTNTPGAPVGHAHSGSPGSNPPLSSPGAGIINGGPHIPHGLPSQPSSNEGKGVHLDKIKLYMPNFLPRSGQSMKFSFAPHNEMALQAFGAQAFPTSHTVGNLPNRGPMPPIPMNHAHGTNTRAPNTPAVVPSNVPRPIPSNDSDVEMIDAVTKAAAPRTSRGSTGEVQAALANGDRTSMDNGNGSSNSAAVSSRSSSHRRSNSVPTVSHNGPLNSTHSTALPNGTHTSVPPSPAAANSATTDANIGDKGKGRALDSQLQHPEVMIIDQ